MVVLSPDGSTRQDIIRRRLESIVDTRNDYKKPGKDGEYLVGHHGRSIMRLPSVERIN
jgi:hypothetical protein